MVRVFSAVLLAGAVLAVAPGAAYAVAEPGADPVAAYRPAEGARPVTGAATTADAPALVAGASYEDTLAPGERYYRVVLDARSSAYVSAVVRPAAGTRAGYSDGVEVSLMTNAGKACPGNPGRAAFGYEPGPLAAVGVRRLEEDADCQEAGVYFVKLTRTSAADAERAPWPVELRFLREPGLTTGGAPTVAPSVWPSAPPVPPGTEPVARAGGTGFNDARALGAGVWRDDLRPGQTRWYRVPLDWGQQLAVGAELAGARMTKTYGAASDGLTVSLYSPYRALVRSKGTAYDGKQAAAGLGPTAPVAYANRFSDDSAVRPVRVAGWYYVAVTMGSKVGEFTEDARPVPLTLRLNVQGAAVAGPSYAESLTKAGFGVREEDRAAARAGLTAPEAVTAAGDRRTMRVVATGGFGAGALLLAVLGGWVLLARRGARTAL
ncbi:hypothetical protein [Streptomyces sp. G-G2]|uniref:hypothetical protein n=1 Tax=Streptomyces sp. G-G2 TaxID=3046201 RepID=UPI0024B8ECAE|nr:hypothetical protein [Streptomyces sp. G-G2]MDJ0380854.1 hypothetical protein [Streptomyces sp. G-G2]